MIERVRNSISGLFGNYEKTNLVWQISDANAIDRRRWDRHNKDWLDGEEEEGNDDVDEQKIANSRNRLRTLICHCLLGGKLSKIIVYFLQLTLM